MGSPIVSIVASLAYMKRPAESFAYRIIPVSCPNALRTASEFVLEPIDVMRSSTSVHVPIQRTIAPRASRNGKPRTTCQR